MAEKKSDDALWIIGIVVLIVLGILNRIGVVTFDNSGTSSTSTPRSSYISGNTSSNITAADRDAEREAIEGGESVWEGKIRLSRGNAASEIQSYKEYITLSAGGLRDEKVNITGWTLTNAQGTRLYWVSGKPMYYSSSHIKIPGAAKIFSTSGGNFLSPVILERGSKVTLNTGSMQNNSQFVVTSFQVNKCSGYLENLPTYDFIPKLSTSACPKPEDTVALSSLEPSCREFVENLNSCTTPQFNQTVTIRGEVHRDCVDGVCNLSSYCQNTLKANFSYNACVARHAQDEDFYMNEWRIFLGQKGELWAKEDETISLFDNEGKLVDSISW